MDEMGVIEMLVKGRVGGKGLVEKCWWTGCAREYKIGVWLAGISMVCMWGGVRVAVREMNPVANHHSFNTSPPPMFQLIRRPWFNARVESQDQRFMIFDQFSCSNDA